LLLIGVPTGHAISTKSPAKQSWNQPGSQPDAWQAVRCAAALVGCLPVVSDHCQRCVPSRGGNVAIAAAGLFRRNDEPDTT
jgi:hypothetical protein